MKASIIFLVSRDDEIGQHIVPTNIPRYSGPQESKIDIISVLGNYGMGSDMHKIKEDN